MKAVIKKVAKKKVKTNPVSLTFSHIGLGVITQTVPLAMQAIRTLGFVQERRSKDGIMLKSSVPQCCKLEFVDLGSKGLTRWNTDGKKIVLGCQNPDELLPLLFELGFKRNRVGVLKHKVLKNSPQITILETQENTLWHVGVHIEGRMCRVCDMRVKFPNLASYLAQTLITHKNAKNGCYSSEAIHGFKIELICGDPQTGHREESIPRKIDPSLSRSNRKRPQDLHQGPINVS